MKLSDYAQPLGVRNETAWRWFCDGKIQGRRIGPRTSMLTAGHEAPAKAPLQRVAVYARVSLAEHKSNLDSQAERRVAYCTARGYPVAKVVKEVGFGVPDARPNLLALLADQRSGLIVVEHKDRLTRFGSRSLAPLRKAQGRVIAGVNPAEHGTAEVLADLPAMVSSCCAQRYGQRRATRETEGIVRELEAKGERDAPS